MLRSRGLPALLRLSSLLASDMLHASALCGTRGLACGAGPIGPHLFTSSGFGWTAVPAPRCWPCAPAQQLGAPSLLHGARRGLSTAATKGSTILPPAVQQYWEEALQGLGKSESRALAGTLDVTQPLGVCADADGGVAGRRVPLWSTFLDLKRDHPTKVALIQIGEFYEAVGIDAVLLVEHCGLKCMGYASASGKLPGVPRAGDRVANLRDMTAKLLHAGFSVVVSSEVPTPYGRFRAGGKTRCVSDILTPSTPHLLEGLVDGDYDEPLTAAPPLLGVAARVGGYLLVEVRAELQEVTLVEGLSEEAVFARLERGGLVPPLYVHVPSVASDARRTQAIPERSWERRMSDVFRKQVGAIERYEDSDPVEGMLMRVRQQLGLGAATQFVYKRAPAGSRPRPLYESTKLNLGLSRTRGVPSLLDQLLPAVSLPAREWLAQLLLQPPPPAVAAAVLRACTELRGLRTALPSFPVMFPENIVVKLRKEQANHVFFAELSKLCETVAAACTDPALSTLSDALLAPTLAGLPPEARLTREQLAALCREAVARISATVDLEGASQPSLPDGRGSDTGCEEGSGKAGTGKAGLDAVGDLLAMNEDFAGKIRAEHMVQENFEVDRARAKVTTEVQALLDMMRKEMPANGSARQRPELVYNSINNALWLRLPKSLAPTKQTAERHGLIHPLDRYGKPTDFYSTQGLETALDAYRRACHDAESAVRRHLKRLAQELQQWQHQLAHVASFATIAAALEGHTREATRRGWCQPVHKFAATFDPAAEECPDEGGGTVELEGLWPYWLDGCNPATVRNSFAMDGMFMLTGPNMAGKSTLLRATAAACLLAACGLHVPAQAAAVPYLDAFMLRTFSADSPTEGRSSFAVENHEMTYTLADATSRSLVMVDELGKGTEACAAAALAGAILQELDVRACKGMFATHLHALLELPLELSHTRFMMMETERVGGSGGCRAPTEAELLLGRPERRPTMRVVPGRSTESLGLEVAYREGLPHHVLRRATQLYSLIEPPRVKPPPSTSSVAAESTGAAEALGSLGSVESSGSTRAASPSPAPSDPEDQSAVPGISGRTLDEASRLLESVTESYLANLSQEATGSPGPPPNLWLLRVGAGQRPPPAVAGLSFVYVVRREDGFFYVGSTDDLLRRLAHHRQRGRVADRRLEAVCSAVRCEQGAASAAREVEALVIRAMRDAGFPLLSDHDARRRHSPRPGALIG